MAFPFGCGDRSKHRPCRKWPAQGRNILRAKAGPPSNRKVHFEPLEPRILLSAESLSYVAPGASDLTLRLINEAGTETLKLLDELGTPVAQRALAETSAVQITGSSVNDSLTVDLSRPFWLPIEFIGNAGSDSLTLQGGNADSVGHRASAATAGSIDLSAGLLTTRLTYSGLDAILDDTIASTRSFGNDTLASQTIRLSDNGSIDGRASIEANAPAGFTSLTFAHPSTALVIHAGDAEDTFILEALEAGTTATIELVGGLGADTVVASADADITLTDTQLAAGSAVYSLAGIEAAELTGGANANTLDASGFTGAAVLDGGAGNDTLIGGTGDDTLLGGAGDDTLHASAGADSLDGGADTDTLVAGDSTNTWTITGVNAGTLNSHTFLDIENLSGGAGDDTFVFRAAGRVTGSIDGGGGSNTFDYSASTPAVTVDLTAGSATGTGGAANIQHVIGSAGDDTLSAGPGSGTLRGGTGDDTLIAASSTYTFDGGAGTDTLVADDLANTWEITGLDSGLLNAQAFASTENLKGGTADDTFVFLGGSVSGELDGAGGSNTLDYAASITAVAVNLRAGTATSTASTRNIRDVRGGAGNDLLIGDGLANVLTGGPGDDTLTGDAGADTLDGGPGTDTVTESRDADFTLTDTALSIGAEGSDTLADIDDVQLTGGASANTFDLSGFAGTASVEGDGGADTLIGPLAGAIWNITGANAGSVGNVAFTSIENLTGGAGADAFVLKAGATIAASIDGSAGHDTLDYSDSSTDILVDLDAGTATATSRISGIESVITGSGDDTIIGALRADFLNTAAGADTLDFSNLTSDVTVTIHKDGTISVTDGVNSANNIFAAENIVTGSGHNTFVFEDGASLAGSITGAGTVSLDYSAYTSDVTVNLATGEATGTAGVANIVTAIGGSGSDTLIGPASDTTWNVTGPGSGNVAGVSFTGFENLTGAADNQDTFVFSQDGSISGLVEGGDSGFDSIVLDGGDFDSLIYNFTGADSGSIVRDGDVITYSGFEPLSTDPVSIPNSPINVTVNYDVDDPQTLTIKAGPAGQTTVESSVVEDVTFNNPSTSLTINAGSAVDTIIVNALDSGFNADLVINAGAGNDDITVNAVTGSGNYTINGEGDTGGDGDRIILTRDDDITLTNSSLTVGNPVTESISLSGIESADLTGGMGDNTFTITGWTGSGTLTGLGHANGDTVVLSKDADFTLTDGSLSATDGPTMALDGVEAAELTGGSSDNILDASGFSGPVTLDGGAGADSLTGGSGNDILLGGTGNDSLYGGAGADSLTGGDDNDTLIGGSGDDLLAGGAGDDTYIFQNGWGSDSLTEAEAMGGGTDGLDFSGFTGVLTTVFGADDDTVTISGSDGSKLLVPNQSSVEDLGVGELDENAQSALLDGLQQLVDWASELAAFGDLGTGLPLIGKNVAAGVGTALDIAEALDQLRLQIKNLFGGSGLISADAVVAELNAQFLGLGKTVSHLGPAIAGETLTFSLDATDNYDFNLRINDEATPVSVAVNAQTDILDAGKSLNVENLVTVINAKLGAEALADKIQAVETSDGRVAFKVIGSEVEQFALAASEQAASKLGFPSTESILEEVQTILDGLGDLSVKLLSGVTLETVKEGSTVSQLRFGIDYEAERTSQFNIDLGRESGRLGLNFDAGATLDVISKLDFDFVLGLNLTSTPSFFLDKPEGLDNLSVVVTTKLNEAGLSDPTNNRDVDARLDIGFLSTQAEGTIALDAGLAVTVIDPTTGNDGFTIADLNPANIDSTVSLTQTASDFLLHLDVTAEDADDFPGTFAATGIIDASGNPFNGRDIALTLDKDFNDNFAAFNNLSASGVTGLLGQLSNWLDDFRGSRFIDGLDIPFAQGTLGKVLDFAEVLSDVLLFDDSTDTPKLLDADSVPRFATAQDLVELLGEIVTLGNVDYDPEYQLLTYEISFTDIPLLDVEAPIEFKIDLSPILNIESGTSVVLGADADLSLTLGFDLSASPEGATATIHNNTTLSELGVEIKEAQAITANDQADAVVGQLTEDATFQVTLDGTTYEVVLPVEGTEDNTTIDEPTGLIDDINAALENANLVGSDPVVTEDISDQIVAENDGNRIRLVEVTAGTLTSFELTADKADPAVRELGFTESQTAEKVDGRLTIEAGKDVPTFLGRFNSNVSFVIDIDGTEHTVTLPETAIEANRNILDLISDVNRALSDAGIGDRVSADSQGMRLVLTRIDGSTNSFQILADLDDPTAIEKLGFTTGQTSNTDDLIITLSSGESFSVDFITETGTSDPTIGQVIAAIENASQLGGNVRVGVDISSDDPDTPADETGTGLVLTDTTFDSDTPASTPTLFKVEFINGSSAAVQLGIVATDKKSPDEERDGVIEGGAIAGVSLLDRFFVENAVIGADFYLSTPELNDDGVVEDIDGNGRTDDGINALASFGFVGISLDGGPVTEGEPVLSGRVETSLKNPETDTVGCKVTLNQLLDNLDDIGEVVQVPSVTGSGSLLLAVGLEPDFLDIALLDEDPEFTITINDLGDPLAHSTFSGTEFTVTDADKFTLADDWTADISPGAKVTADLGDGPVDLTVTKITFDAGNGETMVTVSSSGPDSLDLTGVTELIIDTPMAPDVGLPDNIGVLLGDIAQFDVITFSNVLDALLGLSDFLGQFEAFDFLDMEIPLINQSVNNLLGFAEDFDQALEEVQQNPAGTLQLLEDKLLEALGVGAAAKLTGRPDLTFDNTVQVIDGLLDLNDDTVVDENDDGFFAGFEIIEGKFDVDGDGDVDGDDEDDGSLGDIEIINGGLDINDDDSIDENDEGSVALTDSITRSKGSWVDDGFEAGDLIEIIGDSLNVGFYTIKEIVSDTEIEINDFPGFTSETASNLFVKQQTEPFAIDLSLDEAGATTALRIDLDLTAGFSDSLDIEIPDLDLGDLSSLLGPDAGSIFSLTGAAGLFAEGTLELTLALGIELTDPDNVYIYDDTVLAAELSVGGEDIAFGGSLGPFGLTIQSSEDITSRAAITAAASAGIRPEIFDAGRALLTLDDGIKLNGTPILGDETTDPALTADLTGTVEAELPVFFPTPSSELGVITINGDLADIANGFDVKTDPVETLSATAFATASSDQILIDLSGVIPQILEFDLTDLSLFDNILLAVDGFDLLLGGIQDILDGEIFGLSLPLIGDKLSAGATFIQDFRDDFVAPFREAIETAEDAARDFADPDKNIISGFLFDLLGPSGADILKQLPGATETDSPGDFIALNTNLDEILDLPADALEMALRDAEIEWDVTLGTTLLDTAADIGFDLGVPGLGLETEGNINLGIDWELDLGFGLSFQDGFFFVLNEESEGPELTFDVDADIPASITGTLGFLQLTAEDKELRLDPGDPDTAKQTGLSASFGLDLSNKADEFDTRLSLSEFGKLAFEAQVAAEAAATLGLTLGIGGDLVPAGAAAGFPSVVSDFIFFWQLGDRDAGEFVTIDKDFGDAIKEGLQLVEFRDVSLDLGEYLTEVVGPILEEVQKITKPLQPVIDFLTTPFPVLDDLGLSITAIDLAKLTGDPRVELVLAIVDIVSLVNEIGGLTAEDSLLLPFGDFTIFDLPGGLGLDSDIWSGDFNPQDILDNADELITQLFGDNELGQVLGDLTGKAAEVLESAAGAPTGGFSFPIIEDPSQIFGLLMGKPAVLVAYDLPPLELGFEFYQFFPIAGPLGASITIGAEATIDFAFGYDTLGIQQFVETGFRKPLLLFEGFYVSDTDLVTGEFGTDVPEMSVSGTLEAAAELNLGIARGGVAGGVYIDVFFDLFDPNRDGRVRISEIAGNFANQLRAPVAAERLLAPLAPFDVMGEIYAKLFAFFEINLLFFSIDFEWDITDPITIVDFEIDFFRPPVLASEQDNGDLVINVGEFAEQRLLGDTRDIGEYIQVMTPSPNSNQVKVRALNLGSDALAWQSYEVGTGGKIIFIGGAGDDVFDASGVENESIRFEIVGGPGNDRITLGANSAPGDALIIGGPGDDELQGGSGNDVIFGGGGNDTIHGGGGADLIFGDGGAPGSDFFGAASGALEVNLLDILNGSFGSHLPTDFLRGELNGTDGNDQIYGDSGDDIIFGSGGEDTIDAGGDNDIVIGDGGLIEIVARGTVTSAVSNTLTDSAALYTELAGDPPAPVVRNLSGSIVKIIEGTGAGQSRGILENTINELTLDRPWEIVLAADSRYVILDIRETEQGFSSDDDQLAGGSGDDVIFAGLGNDEIAGGSGDDIIFGEDGFDVIDADADDDLVFGDGGTFNKLGPRMKAGGAADEIQGGPGDDRIFGGDGGDLIQGGDNEDEIYGGSGPDIVFGDNGSIVDGIPTPTFGVDDGRDIIFGQGEPDKIYGGGGIDEIDGGAGNDEVRGGEDPDTIIANKGSDFLDGQAGGDTYLLAFQGGDAIALTNVLDSGDDGVDRFIATGTVVDDQFLLRANNDGSLAFVALINSDTRVERSNYAGVERVVVNGSFGDDNFAVDDTAAEVTLNGEFGNDTFQVGQLFRSPRSDDEGLAAGIAMEDFFATIETTRGFLSNGISAPMTINGGLGNDEFTVFHNRQVLQLNGDVGDDIFEIRAFALAGSQEPQRERTDISGGQGADFVMYAVNAPVNLDGGDGFDTVVVIGTEFGDDLVITEDGVFGAGLNVNFVRIESLRVDGAEGDDRFFVKSTSEKFTTELFGGLGSDTFNMSGDTPPVVSNDLLGHSGLVLHSVESTDELFDGQKLYGISANVADNDEPAIVIRTTDGSTIINEGDPLPDSYQIVLTSQPTTDIIVQALAPIPAPDERELGALGFRVDSPTKDAVSLDGTAVSLRFTPSNWFIPQTVNVYADATVMTDTAGLFTRPELEDGPSLPASFSFDDSAFEGVSFGVVNHLVLANVASIRGNPTLVDGITFEDTSATFTDEYIGRKLEITSGPGKGQSRFVVAIIDAYTLEINRPWIVDDEPTTDSEYLVRIDDALVGSPTGLVNGGADNETFTFTDTGVIFPTQGEGLTGAILQIVGGPGAGQERLILANDDHTLTLNGAWRIEPVAGESIYRIERFDGLALPSVLVQINDNDAPGLIVDETEGVVDTSAVDDFDTITTVIEGGDGDHLGENDLLNIKLTTKPAEFFFDGSSAGVVNQGDDTITIPDHEMMPLGEVVYSAGGGMPIVGLTEGETYYVIVVDSDTIKLAVTLEDAQEEIGIELEPVSAGTDHSLAALVTVTFDFDSSQLVLRNLDDTVDVTELTFNTSNWDTFQQVRVEAFDNVLREGFHTSLINFIVTSSQGDDTINDRIDSFVVTEDEEPIFFVGLTREPVADTVQVTLTVEGETTTLTPGTDFQVSGNKVLFLDGVAAEPEPEALRGEIEVTYDFIEPGFDGVDTQPVLVRIEDNNAPTVLVRETNGSTDVIEFELPEQMIGTELLTNGSFETGDFNGWTIITTGTPYAPWQVTGQGPGDNFGMAATYPQDGSFVAWNGFDGSGPMEFQMYQDVTISAGATATLEWQDRVQWSFFNATQPRTYEVQVRDPASNAVLDTIFTFSTGTASGNGDTGWQTHSADISSFSGDTIRLFFRESIPQYFTGPGQIEFDAISLTEVIPVQIDLITNGDFETGDFTGWTVVNSGLGSNWVINNGDFDPPGDGAPLAPISGNFDAVSVQTGPATQILSEQFVVPHNVSEAILSWQDRIRNFYEIFSDPGQEWRVEIEDAFGNTIEEVFSTNPGDPLQQVGPNSRSFDLTSLFQSLEGQTVAVSFEAQESLFFLNATLDDVSLLVTRDLPKEDTYELVLTGQPDGYVTVRVTPEITKTTRTGGIRHDVVQVELYSADRRAEPQNFTADNEGGSETTLIDSDATFVSDGVKIGSLVRATSGDWVRVVSVDSETVLTTEPAADSWNGQAYTFGNWTVTFTPDDWDEPVLVGVEAIDDTWVDGGDTKEFAPGPNTVSRILGPVFVEGGGGEGSLGIPDPVMLPGETNIKKATGEVADISGDQLTVFTEDLGNLIAADPDLNSLEDLFEKTVEVTQADDAPSTVGQFRLITSVSEGQEINGKATTLLTLNEPYALAEGEAESGIKKYAITKQSLNFFVDESTQIDYMFVHDEDSPADSSGVLNANRLSGLNMGPDLPVGGRLQPGGINYNDLEVLEINLGRGLNYLSIYGTQQRADEFRTWTIINTGDDILDLNNPAVTGDTVRVFLNSEEQIIEGTATAATQASATSFATLSDDSAPFPIDEGGLQGAFVQITSGDGAGQTRRILANTADTLFIDGAWETLPESGTTYKVVDVADGAFALDTQAGDDIVDASASTVPLIIFGGDGSDVVTGGVAHDLIFGDRARVDYLNEDGLVVTRLGFVRDDTLGNAQPNSGFVDIAGNDFLGTPGDPDAYLTDNGTTLPTEDGGLAGLRINIINGQGAPQERIIVSNTENTIFVHSAWDEGQIPDDSSEYRISFIPEDQTDGVVRDPLFLITSPSDLAGNDTLFGGPGEDVLMGGGGDDAIDGGTERDLIFGDNVKLDRRDFDSNGDMVPSPDFTSPRFRALLGTLIYDLDGLDQVDDQTDYVDPTADPTADPQRPLWGNWDIFMNDAWRFDSFGDDYIAGGPADDMIFGQLGDDTIQGDGSIDPADDGQSGPSILMAQNGLYFNVYEGASDGDDYIEGNGDDDVIFGNLGQDDIIGGSSSLFTLVSPEQRPDGEDMIFGGAGTDAARNHEGDTSADGHARDADVILGDNGNIYRLVGINGADGGAFLTFNYDNYGTLKIIPRAVELLDYHPGGLDYDPTQAPHPASNDIGDGDEIHGESGDDFIYGMKGNDILYGEGQDDDIIGGYGHDWISGGTGQDGVIGDDGRIYTSRNGTAEPLYGIGDLAGQLNQEISTPGNIQQATIHVPGVLKKTVNLTPFKLGDPGEPQYASTYDPQFADDIIYGGWGDDFLHGGDGDDAISGAEALPTYYNAPLNPGDVLKFGVYRAGEFGAYDEYDPWSKVYWDPATGEFVTGGTVEFLLNFDHTEGPNVDPNDPGSAHTDGDDVIFGDLGNDWVVGGTGRDHMYGGRGSDLLNADDNHETTGGANTAADGPEASYEDIAYGGAGRDVLIANTGGDRLIDWAGEFNSYIVPYAPFGFFTVSRAPQPQLFDFLYDLSWADGADPTIPGDTGADPTRRGEPEGELGLVNQRDVDWRQQTGAPDDPQPGNVPGGARDILRSATFNSGNMEAFAPDSGVWTVENGALRVSAESLGGDAASVFHVGEMLPQYFEIQATITMEKPTAGWKANSYVIFDYYSPTDFKFAGLNASIDKIQIGHRDETGWIVDVQSNMRIKPGEFYNVLVAVNGTTVTVLADNKEYFSHTFEARVIDGWVYGLNSGMVGFGSDNSRGVYDNIAVQVLPPEITFEGIEEFPDSHAAIGVVAAAGDWQMDGGRYNGSRAAGDSAAVSLVDLGLDHGFEVASVLELEATLSTENTGGVVFDYYASDNFKFAAIDAIADRVTIGHYTNKSGWVYDATFDIAIEPGVDYDLNLSLKGSTVNLSVKEAKARNWQAMVGHVYNAVTVDGDFGLLSKDDSSSFDELKVSTNDPAFLPEATTTLRAVTTAESFAGVPAALSQAELQPILEAAVRRFGAESVMDGFDVRIADLPGLTLGQTLDNAILIDIDAAGHGWFIDPTPADDSEFDANGQALTGSAAEAHIDLLTAVAHELGHTHGLEHSDVAVTYDVMGAMLPTGTRVLPADTETIQHEGTTVTQPSTPRPPASTNNVADSLIGEQYHRGGSLDIYASANPVRTPVGNEGDKAVKDYRRYTSSVQDLGKTLKSLFSSDDKDSRDHNGKESAYQDRLLGDDDRSGYGPYAGGKKEHHLGALAAPAPWVRDFVLDLAENSADDPNQNIAVVISGAGALLERVTRRQGDDQAG